MPRGGARQGKPGKAYPQRADLRAVKPAPIPGGQYGEQTQQQAVINSTPPPAAPIGPAPGSGGPLTRPTERPTEPMSTGAPWGPGANEMTGLPDLTAPPKDPIGASIADLYHAMISMQDKPSIVDAQFARMLRMSFDENT